MRDRQALAAGYIKRFPDAGSQTLARLMFKENSPLFPSLEAARSAIRVARGNHGSKMRRWANPAHIRPSDKTGADTTFAALPEGKEELKDWCPLEIEARLALVLSDIHVPYHKTEPLIAALRYGKDHKADTIILNGDIMDFFSVSFWEKDPRERNFAGELKTGKLVLGEIRKAFPKARIIAKDGNHEERYPRYMKVKAPELLGIAAFEIPALLDYEKLGIEYVTDKRPIRIKSLNIIHGHEFRWGITSPVNPARGFYMRGKENCLGGHLHQTSEHTETSMNGDMVTCWSTGCLCSLRPEYAVFNKWNWGFAAVETFRDSWQVKNLKVRNGKVF